MAAGRISLDLIFEILVWLPAKSILRFNCVCKEWYNLLNSPLFAKLHVNKSLDPISQHNRILLWITNTFCAVDDLYQPAKGAKLNWPKDAVNDRDYKDFVGCCNGLVCFEIISSRGYTDNRNYLGMSFLICNLTTRTFKSILLSSSKMKKLSHCCLLCGFGYDSVHDDYKIVVTRYWLGETNRYACTYSLKTGLWSCSSTPSRVSTKKDWKINSRAIFRNNMLHYLIAHKIGRVTKDYRIARFDVVFEKWRDDLSLPVQFQVSNFVRLGKLDGWLLYLHVGDNSVKSGDVWMIEEDGSWKNMFHLRQDLYMHYLIARSKDGRRHLLLHHYFYTNYSERNKLFWYDQRHNERIPFKLAETLPRDRRSYLPCIASLVAIPGCSLTKLQQVEDGA